MYSKVICEKSIPIGKICDKNPFEEKPPTLIIVNMKILEKETLGEGSSSKLEISGTARRKLKTGDKSRDIYFKEVKRVISDENLYISKEEYIKLMSIWEEHNRIFTNVYVANHEDRDNFLKELKVQDQFQPLQNGVDIGKLKEDIKSEEKRYLEKSNDVDEMRVKIEELNYEFEWDKIEKKNSYKQIKELKEKLKVCEEDCEENKTNDYPNLF